MILSKAFNFPCSSQVEIPPVGSINASSFSTDENKNDWWVRRMVSNWVQLHFNHLMTDAVRG